MTELLTGVTGRAEDGRCRQTIFLRLIRRELATKNGSRYLAARIGLEFWRIRK